MVFVLAPAFPVKHQPRYGSWVCCTPGGTHLPRTAYTTLQADGTPLCRLITGMWQTSGQHGYVPSTSEVTAAIHAAVDVGFSTFDLADVYGDAELYAREYARTVGRAESRRAQFCTKLVLDPRQVEGNVTRRVVQGYVDRALSRMAQERIHLLQLQWADYADKRYVEFLGHLGDLKREGKIRSVGTANFPTEQLKYLQSQDIQVASNQVSFSLLDRRPVVEMVDWCAENNVALLAYSTLGGGFFSEKYLGMPEPTRRACTTASLQRFAAFIRVWGGWSLFQELLYAVKVVADKHQVSMANVAVKWALEQHPSLSAVIVGARLGMAPETDHTLSNVRAFEFSLDDEDKETLDAIALQGNDLYRILGDSGNEYQTSKDKLQ